MTHEIKTGAMSKTVTSYDKDFDVTIDGVEMRIILHWDDHDGFELTCLDKEGRFTTLPDWAWEIHDIGYKLDCTEPHSTVKL